uniref:hypothetical protein n=1 Tax=Butyrivibrio sp. AE3004 TaxID=1506994 RepID=UPI0004940B98
NNPKLSGSIDEVSKQLAGRLKDIDTDAIMTGTDEAAKESLRSQVINALDEISKNTNNKELRNTLSDLSATEIDALINSKYAGDIAKQIDMFSMGAFGVKPETLDKVLDIFDEAEKYGINSKQYYKLEQDAYTLLANDLADGKSFRDKVDAWRYFSMLSAPLTHIRNMAGNTQNNILTGLKNNLSAVIEAAADRATKASGGLDGGRTKSILNALDSADRSLIKLAGDDFDSNAYRQFKQAGNKYINVERSLENAGDVWKDKGLGKVLNKLTGANEYLLDAEDTLFGKAKYQTSLAGFLKANGADSGIFNATDDASKELLAQAREYALKQANEATFHQSNAFANWWSQGVKNLRDSDKAGMRTLGNVANASMPFVKTPSNILAQGWEYSPAEFLNVAADTMKLKKGTMKGTEYIDKLSKALTGTGMVGFGALLAHEGIITIGNGDEEENKFNEKRGIKRLTMHVGDNYIDISQFAPSAIPLLEGAVMYETMRNNKDGDGAGAVDTIFTGLATIGNTVTDMTLLKGISDIMSAARYSEDPVDMAAQVGTKIAGNYVSQMLPTLGAKAEKTIDDTKRTSYTDKQGTFSRAFDQQGRYLKTKIPFLQEAGEKLEGSDNETLSKIGGFLTNEPQIDSWGNEVKVQDYGNGALGRFANNFLNPLDTTTDQHDRVDEELRSLYSEVKDPKVLNFGMTDSKESKVDDHKMTDKEWTQYQKTTGSLKHELAENFMDSEGYAELDGDTKTEAYNKLKGFAKAYSLNEMGLKAPSKSNQALIDAYKEGGAGAVIDSVIGDSAAKAAGVRSNSAAAAEIQESIESGDTEGAQKKADAAQQLKDIGLGYSAPQKAYYDALEGNPDLSVEQFAETYKKLDANGNQSIAQGEFIDYLNANHVSEKDAAALIKDYYPKDKTKIPTLEDGTWKAKKPEQGATQSQTVTDNKTGSYTGSKADIKLDNPTGNATMDAKLKAKQAMREEAKAGKTYDPLDPGNSLPSANYDLPDAGSWSVNVGGKTYNLHDSKGYQKAQSLGVPDNTWLQMYKETDTNGNGRNTKDETKAYIEQLVKLGTIDKSQRADYFDMLNGTKAKNPYR